MKLFRHSVFAFIVSAFIVGQAFASAPQLKTQAPGFYRMMVGDYEVTALFDGFFPMKTTELMKDFAQRNG